MSREERGQAAAVGERVMLYQGPVRMVVGRNVSLDSEFPMIWKEMHSSLGVVLLNFVQKGELLE